MPEKLVFLVSFRGPRRPSSGPHFIDTALSGEMRPIHLPALAHAPGSHRVNPICVGIPFLRGCRALYQKAVSWASRQRHACCTTSVSSTAQDTLLKRRLGTSDCASRWICPERTRLVQSCSNRSRDMLCSPSRCSGSVARFLSTRPRPRREGGVHSISAGGSHRYRLNYGCFRTVAVVRMSKNA